jgi:hypothetical protein
VTPYRISRQPEVVQLPPHYGSVAIRELAADFLRLMLVVSQLP